MVRAIKLNKLKEPEMLAKTAKTVNLAKMAKFRQG